MIHHDLIRKHGNAGGGVPAVFDPAISNPSLSISPDGLEVVYGGTLFHSAYADAPHWTGKHSFEVLIPIGISVKPMHGVGAIETSPNTNYPNVAPNITWYGAGRIYRDGGSYLGGQPGYSSTQLITVMIDLDNLLFNGYVNGSHLLVDFPWTIPFTEATPARPCCSTSGGTTIYNFGQAPFTYPPLEGYPEGWFV